tara:strand:+ start:2178 stop:2615 length:438 start_codon:yes stop_codon:yes gene_type:complete
MYQQTRSTFDNQQEKLLLELFNSKSLNPEQEERYLDSLPDIFPYKGIFSIIVDDKEKAENLLAKHLSVDSVEDVCEYYDNSFYNRGTDSTDYNTFIKNVEDEHKVSFNSKFNIQDLKEFMITLFKSDVVVRDYHFEFPEQDFYCR